MARWDLLERGGALLVAVDEERDLPGPLHRASGPRALEPARGIVMGIGSHYLN